MFGRSAFGAAIAHDISPKGAARSSVKGLFIIFQFIFKIREKLFFFYFSIQE
jgi:hypothetical protein